MSVMAAEMQISKWRNFASWAAVGAAVCVAGIGFGSWLRDGDPFDGFFAGSAPDWRIALVMLASMVTLGLGSRSIAFGWRSFGNFAILSLISIAVFALGIWLVEPLARSGALDALSVSQWVAAGAGVGLLFFAALIGLIPVVARRGLTLMDPDQIETLRERSRLLLLSWIIVAAMGAMLILLGLSGPRGVVSPTAGLAGALAMIAVAVALSAIAWRVMDELDRTLSYEGGNMAFYLLIVIGGGWSMLAHLGFVAAPTPLDWVTMLTLVSFVASFIVAGRRNLLSQ